MATRWIVKKQNGEAIRTLAAGAGIHPLVASILLNRGVDTPVAASRFLDGRLVSLHDPALLPGAAAAAKQIAEAIRSGKKICVYGDYDVDGTTATAIMWGMLQECGAVEPRFYIPSRIDEGYGLNDDAMHALKADGVDLVVSVDCGITGVAQAAIAKEIGLDLIITDHHAYGDVLPDATLVHPRLPGGSYPFGELCGAAVSFKVAWQLAKEFGDGNKATYAAREYLMGKLGLVGMATIADCVPLHDENRIFVRHGLSQLARDPSIGMRALLKVSGHQIGKVVSSMVVSFKLAPRINAAGRMALAEKSVQLFLAEDEAVAAEIAQHLDSCNQTRKEIEKTIVAEARTMVDSQGVLGDRGAIVVGRESWHSGVVGIVAARLVEAYGKPTIVCVLDDEVGHGSARTVGNFNLVEALTACSSKLIGYGGHAAAAGVRVARENFAEFAKEFDEYCRVNLTTEQLDRETAIDADVSLADLTGELVRQIDLLEPYGHGNPRPLFVSRDVRLTEPPKYVGDKKNHAQLRVEQKGRVFKAIAFNIDKERYESLNSGDTIDLCYTPSINEWMGRTEVQLEIKDFRPTEAA